MESEEVKEFIKAMSAKIESDMFNPVVRSQPSAHNDPFRIGDIVIYEPTKEGRIKNLTPGKEYAITNHYAPHGGLPLINDKGQLYWYKRKHFKLKRPDFDFMEALRSL